MTDSETENPPYRPEYDDKTSLNMHVSRKKTKVKHRRTNPAISIQADNILEQLSFPNESNRRVSTAGLSKSFSGFSDDLALYESWHISRNAIIGTSSETNPENNKNIEIARSTNSLAGKARRHLLDYDTTKSLGWSSVEKDKLTSDTKIDKNRRWSIVGDSVVLCPPIAATRSGTIFEHDHLLSSHTGVEDTAMPKHTRRTAMKVKDPSYRNGRCSRTSACSAKPETPTTITLRKASNVYDSEKSGRLIRNEAAEGSAVIGSEPRANIPRESLVNSRHEAHTLFSTAYSEQKKVSVVSAKSARSRTLLSTSASSFDRPLLGSQTVAADSALTFAEVYAIPEVFSPTGGSRRHSLLAIESMRRSSAVMVRSGASIYEIIWDKDDVPSSSSSRPSISWAGSGNSSEVGSLDESSQKTSTGYHCFGSLDFLGLPPANAKEEGDLECNQLFQDAARWSSAISQPDRTLEITTQTLAANEDLEGETLSHTKLGRGGRWSKSWGRYPRNTAQGIESFPPLLERGSTFEWRKTPLVDINDPDAGPSDEVTPRKETTDKDIAEATEEAQVKKIGLPLRDPRSATNHVTWNCGERKTTLGTSSHHRRPSAGPHQQEPYTSLVDLSKSLSRKASRIACGLADKASDPSTERHDPPPQRSATKSTDRHPNQVKAAAGDHPIRASMDNSSDTSRSVFQSSFAAQHTIPAWRKKSSGGLRIDTSGMLSHSRVLRVAELSEVAEDEVYHKA